MRVRPVQVAPSLLAADFGRLAEEAARVEAAGADMIHVDVMDGHFVPNLTLGPDGLAAVRRATELPLDVHLMVEDPGPFLATFRQAGADLLTVHWEACTHLERVLGQIHDLGALAGVAVNPATPVGLLADVWDEIDLVLVMSVNPGFGGQPFWPRAVHKVKQAAEMRGDLERPLIAVDGGVTDREAPRLVQAGADVLVAGTYVFGAADLREPIALLRGVTPVEPPP
jgi:ribulose-phosphate 3-epimerase